MKAQFCCATTGQGCTTTQTTSTFTTTTVTTATISSTTTTTTTATTTTATTSTVTSTVTSTFTTATATTSTVTSMASSTTTTATTTATTTTATSTATSTATTTTATSTATTITTTTATSTTATSTATTVTTNTATSTATSTTATVTTMTTTTITTNTATSTATSTTATVTATTITTNTATSTATTITTTTITTNTATITTNTATSTATTITTTTVTTNTATSTATTITTNTATSTATTITTTTITTNTATSTATTITTNTATSTATSTTATVTTITTTTVTTNTATSTATSTTATITTNTATSTATTVTGTTTITTITGTSTGTATSTVASAVTSTAVSVAPTSSAAASSTASSPTSSTTAPPAQTSPSTTPAQVLCSQGLPLSLTIDVSDCTGRYNGQTCTVTCSGGFQGTPTQYDCIPGQGRFQGTPPVCTSVQCSGGLPAGFNTSACGGMTPGQFCAVSCPPGFIQRSTLYECQQNGLFSGTPPTCDPLPCDTRSLPAGLGMNNSLCQGLTAGANCTAACRLGYSGSPTAFHCRSDGVFEGTPPTCVIMDCSVPASFSSPLLSHTCGPPFISHSQTCVVECAAGYSGTPHEATCDGSTLNVVDPTCMGLACTNNYPSGTGVNASICQGTRTGEICTPTCNRGYSNASAQSPLSCGSDAAFASSALVCAPRPCSNLLQVSNFSAAKVQSTCTGAVFGTYCSAACAQGYLTTGPTKSLVCDAAADTMSTGGFWEVASDGARVAPTAPTCVAQTCTLDIPDKVGVVHNCSGRATDETCTVEAQPGYVGGPFTWTCGSNGALSGPAIAVSAAVCGTPSFAAGVAHTCAGKAFGMTCWTYCQSGYTAAAQHFAQYLCGLSGGSPSLSAIAGTVTCNSNRRLSLAEEPRRLSACDAQAAVNAGLEVQSVQHNCAGLANGDVCIIECANGYNISGYPSTRQCSGGALTDPSSTGMPSCTANTCTSGFPSGVGVTHNCTGTTTSQNCTATCGVHGYGYTAGNGPQDFSCTWDGGLLGTNPSCRPLECNPINLVPGYRSNCDGKTTGEPCLVHCAHIDTHNDVPSVYTCTADGNFSGTLPSCDLVQCSSGWPLDSDLVVTGCTNLTLGETCLVTCASGYTGGQSVYNCSDQAVVTGQRPTCTPDVCPTYTPGAPGLISTCTNVAFGHFCTVGCGNGYQLQAGHSVQSLSCSWDSTSGAVALQGTAPACEAQTCVNNLPSGVAVEHNCGAVATGASCLAWCSPGYTGANATFTCASSQVLNGTSPSCLPATCSSPTLPNAGDNCQGVTVGSTCLASCADGYSSVTGPSQLACVGAGTPGAGSVSLQGPALECWPDCTNNAPLGIQFVHNCSHATTGKACKVECAEGWSGASAVYTCQTNGSFAGTLPSCDLVQCSSGAPLDSDLVVTGCSGLTVGETCLVACASGYTGGQSMYTCSSQAVVTGQRPACTPSACPAYAPGAPGLSSNCTNVAFGHVCTVDCAAGYQLQTGQSAQSFSCSWDSTSGAVALQGTAPLCDALPCVNNLPSGTAVEHDCGGVGTGASCLAWCSPGYAGRNVTFACDGSRAFSGASPTCAPATCSGLSLPNAVDNCQGVTVGSTCSASCVEGYSSAGTGPSQFACTGAGTPGAGSVSLQGTAPTCEALACVNNLPSGIGVQHSCGGVGTGAACLAWCGPGYTGANATFTCAGSRAFGGTSPTCVFEGPLELAQAAFERSFSQLVLTFNAAIAVSNCQPSDSCPYTVACGDVLLGSFVAKLGSSNKCTWSGDRMRLYVLLGSGSTVKPGDTAATEAGALSAAENPLIGGALSATIQQGADALAPTAVLAAVPSTTAACGDALFSAAASSGAHGREVRHIWNFGSQTPPTAHWPLRAAMSEAGMGAILAVSADNLSTAFSLSPDRPLHLEVSVQVFNWLWESGETKASITVEDRTPEWQVIADSPTALTVSNFETARFAVRLQPPATCGAAAPTSTTPPVITWTYRSRAASGGGWTNWATLAEAGLTDRSPGLANVVEFAPFTFTSGSQHQLRARVTSSSFVDLDLSVAAASGLVAQLRGPEVVAPECDFTLDASASADPSRDPAQGGADSYSWACTKLPEGSSCGSLNAFTGPNMTMSANGLLPGSYEFQVTVEAASGARSTGSLRITVASGAPPPMTLTVPWNEGDRVSLGPQTALAVSAAPQSQSCSEATGWYWSWAVVDAAGNRLSTSPPSTSVSPSPMLPTEPLLPGNSYSYALLGGPNPGAAGQYLTTKTPRFIADAPPIQGWVQVVPWRTQAPSASSTVFTDSWYDELPGKLEIALYRLQMPEGTSINLNAGRGRLECLPSCTFPEVDWYNRSSPNYWTKMGVVLLRSWQTPGASSRAISFPVGSHWTVARARDAAGGAGTAVGLGPLVRAPAGAVTLSSARDSLAQANAHGAASVLNAVVTLASSSVASQDKAAVVSEMLGAMETTSQSATLDSTAIQQFGQAVEEVVGIEGASPSLDTLSRSTDILGSIITAKSQAPQGSSVSSFDIADSMLKSLHFLANGLGDKIVNSSNSSTQATPVGVRLLSGLTSLADSAAQELAVGGSEVVSSVIVHNGAAKTATMSVAKESVAIVSTGANLFGGSVVVGGSGTGSSRRLTGTCGVVEVVHTKLPVNILGGGSAALSVAVDTDLKTVSLTSCGSPLQLPAPLSISLDLPSTWPAGQEPLCVWYDESAAAWSTVGVSATVSTASAELLCSSLQSNGTYAVAFRWASTVASTTVSTLTPFNVGGNDTSSGNTGIAVALVAVFSILALCGVGVCTILGMLYRRRVDKIKRAEEQVASREIMECEHEGVGEMSYGNNIVVKQPTQEELESQLGNEPSMDLGAEVQVEILDTPQDEADSGGMCLDVGRDSGARRRFAL